MAVGLAAAALVLPSAMAFADTPSFATDRILEDTVPYGVGAYSGYVNNIPAPFAKSISNNSMAVSPDQSVAVVTSSKHQILRVIDLKDGHRIAEIGGYTSPRNILFEPDGRSISVSDDTLGVLDQISLQTHKVIRRLPLGVGAFGTAQSDEGGTLYATNHAAGTVTVIHPATRRPKAVITGFVQPRQGIKVSPKGDIVYVTDIGAQHIARVSTETNERIGQIGKFIEVRGLSVSRDGGRLFAADSGDNTVSIIDTETGVQTKVKVGPRPYGAALAPNEKVLLSGNLGNNTLTALNPDTGAELGAVTGLNGPRQAIEFSTDSRLAWVLNEDLTIGEVGVQDLAVKRVLG